MTKEVPDRAALAVEWIARRIGDGGPPEQRIRHCEAREDWDVDLLRATSHHELHVLGRGADLVVYFDEEGRLRGWRDDGRLGSDIPTEVDRVMLLTVLTRKLGLPAGTVMGGCRPDKLAHVGWTHHVVLFLAKTPRPHEILHAWVDPRTLRTIQCLRNEGVPGPSEDRGRTAAREAARVLARRIEVADSPEVWRSRPEWYFDVEAGEDRSFGAGSEVRVHTWKHWSGASVTFDTESGEVLADHVERLATPAAERTLTQEQAVAAAGAVLDIPPDAVVDSFTHADYAPGHRVAHICWKRMRGELPVKGDFLEVSVHPDTGRLVSHDRKWRRLTVAPGEASMTRREAIALVEAQRAKLDIDAAMEFDEAHKGIVEYMADRLKPGRREDRVAWILDYATDWGWVQVHVDATTRKVLAVLRSA